MSKEDLLENYVDVDEVSKRLQIHLNQYAV